MSFRSCRRLLFAIAACAALFLPSTAVAQARDERPAVSKRQPPRGYSEAALARGYEDGFDAGLADGRRGKRYDPVATRDYRRGDEGYYASYGSRDAYKMNYRTGFRQGYEIGYRDGTR
jgi:hypothetical protein